MGDDKGVYETLGAKVGALVDEKRQAYGFAIEKTATIMRILYHDEPQTVQEQGERLIVSRLVEKLVRLGHGSCKKECAIEDVVGHGLLLLEQHRRLDDL